MRYRLRTLLILLAIGPPVLAGVWFGWQVAAERYRKYQERAALMAMIRNQQRQADLAKAAAFNVRASRGGTFLIPKDAE
jgi:hypothetical protein